jgi:hypothetical protein
MIIMTDNPADISPDLEETPELPDTDSMDWSDNDVPTELPSIEETPEVPEINDAPPDDSANDVTFHPQPGGIETLPNVEGEPSDRPYPIPEVPYGGMGGERLG